MFVWRLCGSRYQQTAFSGIGGLYAARRWNEKGVLIIYAATSAALAVVEYFVNLEPNQASDDLVMLKASVPHNLVEDLDLDSLSKTWGTLNSRECQKIGTVWLKSLRSVGLRVPSVPVP